MKRKIDLFIVGAPKAGTDSFRHWLNLSRDVHVHGPAEPNYFCIDHLRHAKPVRRWQRRVVREAKGARLAGEKSTWYLVSDAAPELIKRYNPQAWIFILVRDHAGLVKSLHGELMKLGVEPEEDLAAAWTATLADPGRIAFENTAIPNYPASCRIGAHIDRWVSVFGHEQVYLMQIGELDTPEGRARVGHFLGLETVPDAPAPALNRRGGAAQTVSRLPGVLRPAVRALRRANARARSLASPATPGPARPAPRPTAAPTPAPAPDTAGDVRSRIEAYFERDKALLVRLQVENARCHAMPDRRETAAQSEPARPNDVNGHSA